MSEKRSSSDERGSKIEDVERREVAAESPLHKAPTHYLPGTVTDFYEDGKLRLVPCPTKDPKDPLNMSRWRKVTCILTLSLFGAIGLTVQIAIASMLSLFMLEYSGVDMKVVLNGTLGELQEPPPGPRGHRSADMTKTVPTDPGAPSAQAVSLLGSLPILLIGVSNFIAVPLSEVIGRRPVMIALSTLSFVTIPWAAKSTSLKSHLAARCFQALGSGAVESLVPLILQDMSFVHNRNKYIGSLWATLGLMATVIGLNSTRIVGRLSWRWFYWILSIPAGVVVILVYVFLPETRYPRTKQELVGLPPTAGDAETQKILHERESPKRKFICFTVPRPDTRAGMICVKEMLQSLLLLNIVWIVLLNSVLIGISIAAQMTGGSVLVLKPYSFSMESASYIAIPLLLASIFAIVINGVGGDWLALLLTKRNHGQREPEHQLINMILPILCGIAGPIWVGYISEYPAKFHWIWFFVATTILQYGFIAINAVATVYSIESYPQWSASLLVVVTALRNVVSFAMSFSVYNFIEEQGYFGTFAIFGGVAAFFGAFIIPVWYYGRQIRELSLKLVYKVRTNRDETI